MLVSVAVLATACGDDNGATQAAVDKGDHESGDEAASQGAASHDSAESSAGGNGFCGEFAPLNEEADELFSGATPSGSDLRALLDRMAALDPPDEISADFALQVEAFTIFSHVLDGDSVARSQFDERFDEFDAVDERLESFMRDACGISFGD